MLTLEWIGKNKVVNHHQEVPFRVLERQYSFGEQGQHTENNDSENMIIHGDNRRVFKNGQEVYMSRYEYGVLSLMARHPGQLFTKEQIFEAVWHQDSESCLTAVTNTIGRIRQKIEDDRAVPVYIRTISNLGYQFMPNISVKKDSL